MAEGRHAFDPTGRDLSRNVARRRRSAVFDRSRPAAQGEPGEGRPARGRRGQPIADLWKRALALLLAISEVVLLAWSLGAPALAVRQVGVAGLSHLTRGEVLKAAGLDHGGSILLVDGDSIRRDLERLSWVRAAKVVALLPGKVEITIAEWAPVAVYRNGPTGKPVYLNELGTALGPATAPGALPLVQGAGLGDPRVGSLPIGAQLLSALVRIQAGFPKLYGEAVGSFQLDCFGALTLTTDRGIVILFGRVLTPEEFASLSAKLSALKSIAAADPDVSNPAKVQYINLEDVQQPAVKFKSDHPSPAPPGASPAPSPSPLGPSPQATPCR